MNKRYRVMILVVMLGVIYTSKITAQTQEESCTQRSQFETEEDFQRRCQHVVTPPPTITAMSVPQYETNSCTQLLNITQTQFEKDEEFQPKLQQAIKKFNEQVAQHDSLCQAGVATLGQYAVYTEFYTMNIQWQPWTIKFVVIEQGSISLPREEAKSLYQNSEPKHQFPVFFTVKLLGDKIAADKVFVVGSDKEWEVLLTLNPLTVEEKAINVIELFNPKKDSLETNQQYQARRQTLMERYNQAVKQCDPRYQAGTALLQKDTYRDDSLSVSITWQGWAQQAFDLLSENRIAATQEQVVALIREGKEKPVFVSVEIAENQSQVIKPALMGLNESWPLQSLETNAQVAQVAQVRQKEEARKTQYREHCKEGCKTGLYPLCRAARQGRINGEAIDKEFFDRLINETYYLDYASEVYYPLEHKYQLMSGYADCESLYQECLEKCNDYNWTLDKIEIHK